MRKACEAITSLVCANLSELAVGERLGEDAVVDEAESVPFGRAFGFEVPEYPAVSLVFTLFKQNTRILINLPAVGVALESFKLRLDEAAHIVLPGLRPRLDVVHVFAAAVVRGARVSAVVASADTVAVESGGTVSHGARPLTDNGPLVRTIVGVLVVADVLAVLPRLHGNKAVAEARVLVVVNHDILRVVVGRGQEAVESVCLLESVVEHEDTGLRELTLVAERIAVELAGDVWVESGIQRLVEGFNCGDDVVILGIRVLLLNLLENGQCAVDCVALLPTRFRHLLARVVEAVLRAGSAVEIDDDFHADLACPVDTLLEELRCALRVWRVGVIERPVSNRDSDHVEATVSDLLKVRKLHPFLPVGPQDIVECCLCAE